MKRQVSLGSRKGKDKEKEAIARTIRHWMHSWMRRGLESEAEYEISKALFLAYLDSVPVKNVIGEIGVESVKDFARNNVFPHEQNNAIVSTFESMRRVMICT
jgi:hypothetical protein